MNNINCSLFITLIHLRNKAHNNIYRIYMQSLTSPIRIVQVLLSIGFLTLSIIFWQFNEIGQNIINLSAFLTLLIGLDNIIIYYRCYRQKSALQHQSTFVLFCLIMLGAIFENFNKSYGDGIWFNKLCTIFVYSVVILNFTYYAGVIFILFAYLLRQIYRLMTQTLLNANTNLDREHLNRFIQQNKRTYQQVHAANEQVNTSCSICLLQFDDDSECILLPSCQHCFHLDCISQWLSTKSTCPYCRHNIQLDLLVS